MEASNKNIRHASPLVVLLCAMALLSGCATKTAQTAPNLAVPVTVAKAVEKTVPIELTAIGTGEAYSKVSIESQVNGILDAVHFQQGDFVKKGQLLFTLDARPFQAALAQAQGNLARDKAQAELAHVQAERYAKLFHEGVAPRETYDQNQATAEADDAAVRADQAAVEAANLNLQYCTITSPIDGRTGALQVYPGNLVKQNDVPVLVVINQITPLFVDFSVPEQYLSVIKKYMAEGRLAVQAVPYGDTVAENGYLSFVDNTVDNTTGTIKLKGTFPNPDHRLWPGQFSTVTLRLAEEEDAITVPSQAIQTGQDGQFVYVVTADNSAENRPVKVARTLGGEAIVSQGLKPGETVVTDGQLRLLPGIKVEIRQPESGGPAGS
ncbi:MAG TPA: efflux RND transporter periplasmic adaptor subunit [Candidatus Acidoferrum sp.]|nr:efflux RND transporter periplasmic adaptor subunit [Candidatus Acidoferrum sp.]